MGVCIKRYKMDHLYAASNKINEFGKQIQDKGSEIIKSFQYTSDKYKTLMQMVKEYNYPIEKHFYETEDGYINCLFRISGPRYSTAQENLKRN